MEGSKMDSGGAVPTWINVILFLVLTYAVIIIGQERVINPESSVALNRSNIGMRTPESSFVPNRSNVNMITPESNVLSKRSNVVTTTPESSFVSNRLNVDLRTPESSFDSNRFNVELRTGESRLPNSLGHSGDGDTTTEKDFDFIIAVDATPSKAGGLLLHESTKSLYYYSFTWTGKLSFSPTAGPDKFEMINALFAAQVFSYIILTSPEFRLFPKNEVLVKADNSFANDGYKKTKNAPYRAILDEINKRLPFKSICWKQTTRQLDLHMQIADKLSRNTEYAKELMGQHFENYSGFLLLPHFISVFCDCVIDKLESLAQIHPDLRKLFT